MIIKYENISYKTLLQFILKNKKKLLILILFYKYKNLFYYYYKHKKFYYRKFKTIFYLIIFKLFDIIYGVNFSDRNIKYINFYIYENFYKIPIIFNKIHNDIDIESITCDNIDVSQDILPFMGPNYNFYNMNITPNDLQYKNLNFIINNKTYNFKNNDLIKFKND